MFTTKFYFDYNEIYAYNETIMSSQPANLFAITECILSEQKLMENIFIIPNLNISVSDNTHKKQEQLVFPVCVCPFHSDTKFKISTIAIKLLYNACLCI